MTAINFKLLSLALENIELSELKKLKQVIDSKIKLESKKSISKRPLIEIDTKKPSKMAFDKSLWSIINEDWSELFKSYSNDGNNFYVYFHGRPGSQRGKYKSLGCITFITPFYVGIGQGDRLITLKEHLYIKKNYQI